MKGRTLLFQIELPISPQWKNVSLLRGSVRNCLSTIFQDSEFCQSVGTVTSELLENAVKYGDWERNGSCAFRLKVTGDQTSVQVEVTNPVDTKSRTFQELMETVEFLQGFEDPEDAYRAKMRQIAERDDIGTVSQLGLARIAYEGNCKILAEVDADDVLHMKTHSLR